MNVVTPFEGIGAAVKRKEDPRFLSGRGQYTDDLNRPGQAYAVILRSPHPHARIVSIDTSAARAMPGVVAVFTGEDLKGVGGLPCGWAVKNKDGSPMAEPPHPVLAMGKVRHVGDPVAVAIAETRAEAQDAAEAIRVEYEVLPSAGTIDGALAPGAAQIHDAAPGNVCYDWHIGDPAVADAAFARAHKVVVFETTNNRLIPNAMEPRAAIGDYDPATGEHTLITTSQNPHVIRLLMGAFVLNIPESRLRVVAPDVGGGFGSKIYHYAEEALVTWAAAQLKRPVKWTADRSESFMSDAHGRDHVTRAALALDKDGTFLGLKVSTRCNMGAYLSTFAPAVPTYLYATLLAGVYRTPVIYAEVKAVFTNTVPVDAYRGAGRPEATFLLERLVDVAAAEMGMDRIELRRRNFIKPDMFPYQTPVALQYDSGNYDATLDAALKAADWAGFEARRAEAAKRGKLRGIGCSTYLEACGIAPSHVVGQLGARAGLYEVANIRVHPTGSVTVFTGTHSHGQGHETTFAQLVSDRLGVPVANIDVVHGDTGKIPFGMGTYGSRSLADGEGDGQDHRQGQAHRGASDGGLGRGHRVRPRHLPRRRHGQDEEPDRHQPRRLCPAQLPDRGDRARPRGNRLLRPEELHLPRRLPHRRGGDRPGHRRHLHRQLRRGGRCRPRHQPDDRGRPGPGRRGAGHRPGAAGERGLCAGRAAAVRQHDGLHHAARR
jgi:carbon-monoxide dehydrogenase large subunit